MATASDGYYGPLRGLGCSLSTVCVACALARATRVRDVNGMRASRCWYEGRPWREALGSIGLTTSLCVCVPRGEFSWAFSMPREITAYHYKRLSRAIAPPLGFIWATR